MLRVVEAAAASVWAGRRSLRAARRRPRVPGDGRCGRRSVLAAFGGLGFQVGVWAVLLADVSRALGLSAGALGQALSLVSVAGVVALVLGGRVVDRVGRRPFLVVGGVGLGAAFVGLGRADGIGGVRAAFAAVGLAAGFLDLAVNALGGDYERQSGERAMTLFHAGFSAAAAGGALLSGAVLAAGVDFRAVYGGVGVSLVLLFGLLAWLPLPRGPVAAAGGAEDPATSARHGAAGVAVAAALVGATFLVDAALEGYASIYLRTILAAGAMVGGAGIAAFHLIGTVGRLASVGVVRRVGERAVLVEAGCSGAVGLAVVAAGTRPAVVIGGLVVVGVSLAPVVPLAFSLAARADPGRSGRAVAVVTFCGYGAFVVGPVLTGALADAWSLRAALGCFALSGVTIAAVARWAPLGEG